MSIEKMSINDKRESKHASKSNEVLTLVPKNAKILQLRTIRQLESLSF